MADELGEKTEEPTPKRRQDAREEGNVAKSQDFTAAILLIAVTLTLAAAAMWMLEQGTIALEYALDPAALGDSLHVDHGWELTAFLSTHAVRIALPLLLIGWMAGVIGVMLQVGWLFTTKAVQPKISKLNPIKGFQRIFGISGLVKVTLDSLKVLIITVVATLTVWQYGDRILVMPYLTVLQCLSEIGWLMFDLALRVLAVLLLLGVLDFIYQKWKNTRDLRMTKQQVKDEMKQSDGDPETKKRRMRMQQEIASQRVASAVPKADVIVTNPEHISIAIQYDPDTMHAPRVVAKGADFLALRIRQIAMMHSIPIIERKPLARALYKDVPVGAEIPPDFYQAVAEILAYVFRMNERMAG
jgi:flagellar biosynthesis protein FlhB